MNIQRFTAATSREAMAKARNVFGDTAVILSSRATDDGFEVMAAAEESLAAVAPSPAPLGRADRVPPIRTRNSAPLAPTQDDSVEDDAQTLSMSTLSFQEYVRERMLRKRRAALGGEVMAAGGIEVPHPAPVAAPVSRNPAPLVDEPPPIRTRAQAPAAVRDEAPPARADDGTALRLSGDISALRELIEDRFNTLTWLGASRQSPVQSNLMLKLIRAGFSPGMVRAVLERIPPETTAPEAQRWVLDTLTRNLRAAAPGAGLCDEGGVIALIGATGVGKTTTAAKLAAQCVKQYGTGSVGLITLDTYRVSGYEQLRAYGRLLGVVAHLAHDRAALKDLLNLLSGKRMVVIDTAGLGQRDQRIQELHDLLDMPKMKKVMVLNAGSHGDTIDDVLTAFKGNGLHGAVLAKVDEAVKLGPALDALIRHQTVLRGVANGQRVPEDWQDADPAALVRQAVGSDTRSAHDPLSTELGFYFAQSSSRGISLGAAHV
jgi:flagellar biosynthesis protein FlhF